LYIARVNRLSFLLFFLFSGSLRAQEIAPLASFEFGSPIFFNRDAGVLNQFGGDSAGTSSCYSYGIGADLRWPKLIGDFGLASNVQFIYSTGRFDFTQVGASVTGVDRKLSLEMTALRSIGDFGVRAGGWASWSLHSNVFEHDSAGNNITPAAPASARFHAGLALGGDYQFGDLRASLFGNYDLTANAGVHGLTAGISLAYVLTSSEHLIDEKPEAQPVAVRQNLSTVAFTVNDTPHYHNVPVQKVERHIHEYSMRSDMQTASQKDSIYYREWIEESYHLPHIRLRVTTKETSYIIVTANEALLNRFQVRRDSSLTINDLSALDIHKTNQIVARVENGSATDTLILPEISSDTLPAIASNNEFRLLLSDKDSTGFNTLLERMTALLPTVKEIIVRTPHGETWAALTRKIRAVFGNKAKYQSAYHAKEITVIMSD
jgi:hypothetical protein